MICVAGKSVERVIGAVPLQLDPSILELVQDRIHVAKIEWLTVDGEDRNEQFG